MNIYLMNEDGESFCIKAETMKDALNICEESYLDDRKNEEPKNLLLNIENEKKYYYDEILQSCTLVAELKN